MEEKAIARRLSEIHDLAFTQGVDVAIDKLRHLEVEVSNNEPEREVDQKIVERIKEMEIYVLMTSSGHSRRLLEAVIGMIDTVDTSQPRKIETINIGLKRLLKSLN